MKAFIAFTKKEFTENLRTYRLIILVAVFILLGVMSPLVAKLTPMILQSLATTGLNINMPEPVAMDSWAQFFKNVGQLGMLALAIIFSGIMANEFNHQTLVNLLTKGMKRHTVVFSKFLMATILWIVSYGVCLAVCFAYTAYYWPGAELSHAFLAFLAPWLFGELLIAILMFGGTLFASFYGSLLSCGAVVIILNVLSIYPNANKYNPIMLSTDTLNLLNADKLVADYVPAMIITVVAIIVLLVATVTLFNKKQL